MHFKMNRFFHLILVLFLFSSCAYELNPTTGKKEIYKKSWDNELKVASKIETELSENFTFIQNTKLKKYIQKVANAVVQESTFAKDTVLKNYPNFKLNVEIINSETVSSFIVPPNKLYLSTGLLIQLNNEAQLANVIGLQLAHLENRPFASRNASIRSEIPEYIQINQLAETAFGLPEQFSLSSLSKSLPFLFASFSKDAELEAYKWGSQYTSLAAYKASESVVTIKHLTLISSPLSLLPIYQHTHSKFDLPLTTETQLALDWQNEEAPEEIVNAQEYLAQITGLTIRHTKDGYKVGKTVYHPKLLYQFNMPESWNFSAIKNRITLTDDNNSGILIIQAVQKSVTFSAVVNEWLIKNNLTADFRKSHFINELNRYETYSTLTLNNQNYTIFVGSVEMNSYHILIKAIALSDQFNALKPYFVEPFFSLIAIPDPSITLSKPLTLNIIKTDTSAELKDFYPRDLKNVFSLQEFSFMNQKNSKAIIEQGTILKTVQ